MIYSLATGAEDTKPLLREWEFWASACVIEGHTLSKRKDEGGEHYVVYW
jgi:hypothetical protein